MATDRWGLKKIYPPAKTRGLTGTGKGFEWYQSDDITDDKYFSDEGHVSNSGGGVFTMSTSGPDAVQIAAGGDVDASVTGGCGMNFDEIAARGYGHSKEDPRDIELTFLVKFVSSDSDNGFAVEGPTGSHSGSGCCSGNCYKFDIQYRPNPTKFRYRKEMWHVDNTDDPKTGEFTHPKFNFQLLGRSEWTGFKWIRFNKKDGAKGTGHNTDDSVVLEVWANIHPDDDPLDWFLLKHTEDKGGWGDSGDECSGDKDQIGSFSMPKFRLKSNDEGGEFDFKHVSLVEVDPTGSFGSTPDPTDTPSETGGVLSLKYDINTYRTSACSPGGSVKFYDSGDDGNSWTISDPDQGDGIKKTRVGEYIVNSNSKFVGKKVVEADYYLMKVGSPTGTATVRIRNGSNTIKATLGTIDVSTLTGSMVLYPFINLANTYVMQPNNYLMIEYNGGSTDNFIRIAKRDTSLVATDGVNTKAVYYDDNLNTYHYHTNREVSGQVWEDQ